MMANIVWPAKVAKYTEYTMTEPQDVANSTVRILSFQIIDTYEALPTHWQHEGKWCHSIIIYATSPMELNEIYFSSMLRHSGRLSKAAARGRGKRRYIGSRWPYVYSAVRSALSELCGSDDDRDTMCVDGHHGDKQLTLHCTFRNNKQRRE